MKNLQFRVWDKRQNKMAVGYSIIFNEGRDPQVNYRGYDRDGDDWIIMQSTNLKDKNGKEIYEGDILSGWNKKRKIVKWNSHGWNFQDHQKNYTAGITWEVIGNIWENSELLTNSKN